MNARAFLATLVAVGAAPDAAAVYQCGPQKDDCPCGANNPYPCCSNGGNCTWWAWEAACCNWKVGLPGWGNANQWAGHARANGNYAVLSYPVTSAISCRASGTYGHVAWVTSVSGGTIGVTEQNCWGGYGMQSATYSASFFDGGFIVRAGQTQCRPGDSQTQSCGTCGTQVRRCGTDGRWGAFGTCSGEGACLPGQSETVACGTCGQQTRTCSGSCQWDPYSACAGADPNGGKDLCDTGRLGVCAAGTVHCVAGELTCEPSAQKSPEVCNGLDDDCDGATDEDGVCPQDAGAALDASTGTDGETAAPPDATGLGSAPGPSSVEGGCGCGPGPDDPLVALALGAAFVLRRRLRKAKNGW